MGMMIPPRPIKLIQKPQDVHICLYCNTEREDIEENCEPCGALFVKTMVMERYASGKPVRVAIVHSGEIVMRSKNNLPPYNCPPPPPPPPRPRRIY